MTTPAAAAPPVDPPLIYACDPRLARAEEKLRSQLRIARLEILPNYTAAEVQAVLRISPRTFDRMVEAWEPPGTRGRQPIGIETFRMAQYRRVTYSALVDWLARNSIYEREIAPPDRQIPPSGSARGR